MLDIRIIHPLEKVFLDAAPQESAAQSVFSGFQNESISFQIAVCRRDHAQRLAVRACVDSPLGDQVTLRSVRHVPVVMPTAPGADDNYLRKTPGLYPDLLRNEDFMQLQSCCWHTYWVEVTPNGTAPGEYPVTVYFSDRDTGETLGAAAAVVRILPGELPAQKLIRTSWFHSDCLAQHYNVPVFSEEYWKIVERFMETAVRRGHNMILTPLFTPPLDTAVGGERPTVQLVDVTVRDDGYTFDFGNLVRWVDIAKRAGMRYFEMSHLFTQWGARHAPKIMATVKGEYKRIFGWETDAQSREYADFLGAFLPALMLELRALGIKDHTYFHISDEPNESMIADYTAARDLVRPYVEGCPIIDALSSIDFYKTGAVLKPIPAFNHLQPFLDEEVPGLWTYYCCGQFKDTVNQFLAMPGARTRMLGVLLYYFNIEGFLQWGYNFYNSQRSLHRIDPYATTDADGVFPAGDPFLVYPGMDGCPEESMRLLHVHMAMQDLRALNWLESLTSREYVLSILTELAGDITPFNYPRDAAFFNRLRMRINNEIMLLKE